MSSSRVYQVVTERIIAALESGTVPWRKPWSVPEHGELRNAITGHRYRGINTMILALVSQSSGYTDPRWITYKQAQAAGGNVRKGEKGSPVVFWKWLERTNENGETEEFPILRYFTVFNAEQCDGLALPEIEEPAPRSVTFIDVAETVIRNMPNRPEITHDGVSRAFYRPETDTVHLPEREWFESDESYYAVAFHELGHSTGHTSRLARKTIDQAAAFGSETYSREELVAEFTSAFLCGEVGIADQRIPQNAAYVASWLQALKDDEKAVVIAAGQGQRAADYILGADELKPTPRGTNHVRSPNMILERPRIHPNITTGAENPRTIIAGGKLANGSAEALLATLEDLARENGEQEYVFPPHEDDGRRDVLNVRHSEGGFEYLFRLPPAPFESFPRETVVKMLQPSAKPLPDGREWCDKCLDAHSGPCPRIRDLKDRHDKGYHATLPNSDCPICQPPVAIHFPDAETWTLISNGQVSLSKMAGAQSRAKRYDDGNRNVIKAALVQRDMVKTGEHPPSIILTDHVTLKRTGHECLEPGKDHRKKPGKATFSKRGGVLRCTSIAYWGQPIHKALTHDEWVLVTTVMRLAAASVYGGRTFVDSDGAFSRPQSNGNPFAPSLYLPNPQDFALDKAA